MTSALTGCSSIKTLQSTQQSPCFSKREEPTVLADIYQDNINIAIWQRNIGDNLIKSADKFITSNVGFSKSLTVSPENAYTALEYATNGEAPDDLLTNMAELVDMFCYLFELEDAGLRLATLNSAMCPRFHVDQVPCRLVTSYFGSGTQWLQNSTVDRSKLGRGSNGLPDSESGLYDVESDIQQLACGDVALLKGGRWIGNEHTGLVHRSPNIMSNETRLLMTLDFG
ncbi:DUF1826 domain-containing protein [Vibrio sp. VNB-15]